MYLNSVPAKKIGGSANQCGGNLWLKYIILFWEENYMKKIGSVLTVLLLFVPVVVFGQMGLPSELIDIPTAYAMQRGDLSLDFRIYDGGGVLTKVQLGIVDMLSLGLSLSVDGLIGSGQLVIPMGRPGIIAKIRIVDEMTLKSWPTITIGYDDSAYNNFFGKGIYGMVSKEFTVGKMFLHAHGGINKPLGAGSDIIVAGIFLGADFFFIPQFALIGEIEPASQIGAQYISYNFGFQYMPIPNFRAGFFTKTRIGTVNSFIKEIHVGYITKLF